MTWIWIQEVACSNFSKSFKDSEGPFSTGTETDRRYTSLTAWPKCVLVPLSLFFLEACESEQLHYIGSIGSLRGI